MAIDVNAGVFIVNSSTPPDSKRLIILDGVTRYVLDCTENFERGATAQVSSNPLASGASSVNNISLEQKTVTFSGVISDTKLSAAIGNFIVLPRTFLSRGGLVSGSIVRQELPSLQPTTVVKMKDFVDGIDAIMADRRTVSVVLPEGYKFGENGAVITSFSISRDTALGLGLKVSITLTEVTLSQMGYISVVGGLVPPNLGVAAAAAADPTAITENVGTLVKKQMEGLLALLTGGVFGSVDEIITSVQAKLAGTGTINP